MCSLKNDRTAEDEKLLERKDLFSLKKEIGFIPKRVQVSGIKKSSRTDM